MIEILIAVLLLLAIFMMIFAMLLISAYIVNSLIQGVDGIRQYRRHDQG